MFDVSFISYFDSLVYIVEWDGNGVCYCFFFVVVLNICCIGIFCRKYFWLLGDIVCISCFFYVIDYVVVIDGYVIYNFDSCFFV